MYGKILSALAFAGLATAGCGVDAGSQQTQTQTFDACTTREERNDDVEKFPLSGREGKGGEEGIGD